MIRHFLRRHCELALYIVYFLCGAFVLYYGVSQHLFSYPPEGTDQRTILECARALVAGKLPGGHYRYSYSYTTLLALLNLIAGGQMWLTRILQLALAALIPPLICRTARLFGWGKSAGVAGALLFVFSAAPLLIALDFLRAAPLALAFLALFHCFALAEFKERTRKSRTGGYYAAAGILAALCILGRENFLAVMTVPVLYLLCRKNRSALTRFLPPALLPLAAVVLFNGIYYHSFQLVPGNVGNIARFYGGADGDISRQAVNLLGAIPRNLLDFLGSYEIPNSLSVYAHRDIIPMLRVFAVPFNLLVALGALGSWFRRRESGAVLAALLAAAYVASMMFFTVFYRFRVPLTPLLALLAAGNIGVWAQLWKRGRRAPVAAALLIVLGFTLATAADPESRRTVPEQLSVVRVLVYNDRLGEAEKILDRLAGRGVPAVPERRLLARKLASAGDEAGAIRVISRIAPLFKRP